MVGETVEVACVSHERDDVALDFGGGLLELLERAVAIRSVKGRDDALREQSETALARARKTR